MDGGKHRMVSPWMDNWNIVEFLRKNPEANPLKLARPVFTLHTMLLTSASASGRRAWSSVPPQHRSRTRRS
jgi:hypothetical protein